MPEQVTLEVDGPIATITNRNPAKHNAFTDAMDAQLWEILADLKVRPDVRAVIWQGEGPSWSSGRDVSAIGGDAVELPHHHLMERGIRGIQQLWDIPAVVIVACKGWVMGGSFQRALLCDLRIAAEGTRFRLPEMTHGVISRLVPEDELDATARDMAEQIAAAPAISVKMARMVIAHLSRPAIRAAMEDEMIYQTFINRSDDAAELRASRAEQRPPTYRGS